MCSSQSIYMVTLTTRSWKHWMTMLTESSDSHPGFSPFSCAKTSTVISQGRTERKISRWEVQLRDERSNYSFPYTGISQLSRWSPSSLLRYPPSSILSISQARLVALFLLIYQPMPGKQWKLTPWYSRGIVEIPVLCSWSSVRRSPSLRILIETNRLNWHRRWKRNAIEPWEDGYQGCHGRSG